MKDEVLTMYPFSELEPLEPCKKRENCIFQTCVFSYRYVLSLILHLRCEKKLSWLIKLISNECTKYSAPSSQVRWYDSKLQQQNAYLTNLCNPLFLSFLTYKKSVSSFESVLERVNLLALCKEAMKTQLFLLWSTHHCKIFTH